MGPEVNFGAHFAFGLRFSYDISVISLPPLVLAQKWRIDFMTRPT